MQICPLLSSFHFTFLFIGEWNQGDVRRVASHRSITSQRSILFPLSLFSAVGKGELLSLSLPLLPHSQLTQADVVPGHFRLPPLFNPVATSHNYSIETVPPLFPPSFIISSFSSVVVGLSLFLTLRKAVILHLVKPG